MGNYSYTGPLQIRVETPDIGFDIVKPIKVHLLEIPRLKFNIKKTYFLKI